MPKQSPRPFAQNLKKARKYWGWTQAQLSRMASIPASSLGAYEEDRAQPPMERLAKIVKVLRVQNVTAFLEDAEFDPKK